MEKYRELQIQKQELDKSINITKNERHQINVLIDNLQQQKERLVSERMQYQDKRQTLSSLNINKNQPVKIFGGVEDFAKENSSFGQQFVDFVPISRKTCQSEIKIIDKYEEALPKTNNLIRFDAEQANIVGITTIGSRTNSKGKRVRVLKIKKKKKRRRGYDAQEDFLNISNILQENHEKYEYENLKNMLQN